MQVGNVTRIECWGEARIVRFQRRVVQSVQVFNRARDGNLVTADTVSASASAKPTLLVISPLQVLYSDAARVVGVHVVIIARQHSLGRVLINVAVVKAASPKVDEERSFLVALQLVLHVRVGVSPLIECSTVTVRCR